MVQSIQCITSPEVAAKRVERDDDDGLDDEDGDVRTSQVRLAWMHLLGHARKYSASSAASGSRPGVIAADQRTGREPGLGEHADGVE